MILEANEIFIFDVRPRIDLASRVVADGLHDILAGDTRPGNWHSEKIIFRKSSWSISIGVMIVI